MNFSNKNIVESVEEIVTLGTHFIVLFTTKCFQNNLLKVYR